MATWRTAFHEIARTLGRGHVQDGLAAVDAALGTWPDASGLLVLRAQALLTADPEGADPATMPEARRLVEAAIDGPRIDPDVLPFAIWVAHLVDLGLAEDLLARRSPDDPPAASVGYVAGLVAARDGDLAGAEAELRRAHALAPQDVGIVAVLAQVLGAGARRADAVALLEPFVARRPDRPELADLLAWLREEPGGFERSQWRRLG
jgi:hypothetical protein